MYEILYLRTLAFPVIIKLRVMGNLPSGYTRVLVSPRVRGSPSVYIVYTIVTIG
jgi:hypothetical protein